MKRNVGLVDAGIRATVGIAIAIAGIYFNSWWGSLAIIPIITALTGYCPLYELLGFNTCKK